MDADALCLSSGGLDINALPYKQDDTIVKKQPEPPENSLNF
jgi:hypothetical protein